MRLKLKAALIIVAAIILAISGFYSIYWKSIWRLPHDGVIWSPSSEGPVAEFVEPAGPAAHAGIQKGDTLQSINGKSVKSVLSAEDYPWREKGESPLALKVKRGNEVKEVFLMVSYEKSGDLSYYYLAIVGFFMLFTGTYLALRMRVRKFISIYFLLSITIFVLFVFSPTGRNSSGDRLLYGADLMARIFLPALLINFVLVFSRGLVVSRKLAIPIAYIPSLLILLLNIHFFVFRGVYDFADPVRALEIKDRMELLLIALSVIAAAAILIKSYFKLESFYDRAQIRWMIWGIGLGFGPFALIYGIPYALAGEVPLWTEFSVFPVIILPLAFSSALLKYRLMDLDLYLKKGLFYLSLAFFTLGIFAAVSIVIERLVRPVYDPGEKFFAFLAALVTAFIYPRLRKGTRYLVEKLFYREKYNFRQSVLSFIQDLNSHVDMTSLVSSFSRKIVATLNLKGAFLFLKNDEKNIFVHSEGDVGRNISIDENSPVIKRLTHSDFLPLFEPEANGLQQETAGLLSHGIAYLFPMKVKGELRAILGTGERSEGSPLNSEDLLLIATLSGHAAAAIESARLFGEVSKKVGEINRLMEHKESILESSKIGIMVINSSGKVFNWNRALEEIHGMARNEVVGRSVAEIFPAHLARHILDRVNNNPGGKERAYRYTFINRTGRRIIVNIAISSLEQKTDFPVQYVVTFDDVTEQVKLEEKLLRQERLASIGLLAAGVAHEVNTPLTGISSYAQMLLEEMDKGDPRYEILKKIESQSARASSIANSLLKFTRGDSEAFEKIDINEIIEDSLSLFESQLQGKKIDIEKNLGNGIPLLQGSKNKLQQVFLNILLNSRDALESGGGTIKVESRFENEKAIVEICDNGVGIAREDISRIFDPFFTTKGRGKGTGLGLSISYGIIKEHQGEVSVESVPGKMTRFTIEFPVGMEARLMV
ncbi:MAG: ATP-binding protein [Acidobacteriota bacterium]